MKQKIVLFILKNFFVGGGNVCCYTLYLKGVEKMLKTHVLDDKKKKKIKSLIGEQYWIGREIKKKIVFIAIFSGQLR